MKKIFKEKNLLYIFATIIIILIPLIKQLSFYLVKYDVINNYDSINVAYLLYMSIPVYIYLYIKNIIKEKRKLDIFDYIFYILVITSLISSIFSLDKSIAFLGKEYRHEGFLTIFSYYLIFINIKNYCNKKDINKFINIIIWFTIFNCLYALLQVYTDFSFILRYGPNKQMASGILCNPNFFGSLITTVLSIVSTKLLIEKINIKNILIFILLLICLINCQSTGPFIAYIITSLFMIIYLIIIKKINIKNIVIYILTVVIVISSVLFINNELVKLKTCELCELNNTSEEVNNSESQKDISNGRFDIWKNSLNIVKDNYLVGVGYDNFHLAYYEGVNLNEVYFATIDGVYQPVRKYVVMYDNAHNIYLHKLISVGILGIIPYLLLCLLTFINGLKNKDNLSIILLGGFIAYSIQAFSNIDVIQVAPIYYVIIGLILSVKQ